MFEPGNEVDLPVDLVLRPSSFVPRHLHPSADIIAHM
ncbi:MAG: hypothetical protein QOG67_3325 [Verrucomicrobiota bacterium]